MVEAPECRPPPKDIYARCVAKAKTGWRGFSDDFAFERAQKFCTGVEDLAVFESARLAYQAFDSLFATEHALDAAKKRSLRGKSELFGYALDQMSRTYKNEHGHFAVGFVAGKVEGLASSATKCVKDVLASYKAYDIKLALERAFEACAKLHPPLKCPK